MVMLGLALLVAVYEHCDVRSRDAALSVGLCREHRLAAEGIVHAGYKAVTVGMQLQ